MMQLLRRKSGVAVSLLVACLVLFAVGCPPGRAKGTAKVTTLLTADASAPKTMAKSLLKQNEDFVPIEDIVSLSVTITKIVLVPTSELGGNGGKQDVPASHVLVFEGVLDVNLKELIGVSEVLSSAEIPADTSGEIRLSISDPRRPSPAKVK